MQHYKKMAVNKLVSLIIKTFVQQYAVCYDKG